MQAVRRRGGAVKPLYELGWFALRVINDVFFPGTIASEYLHKTRVTYDWDVLCKDIVRRRSGVRARLPPPDAIVVHLRLGDDIE